jgi:hypothetical protein
MLASNFLSLIDAGDKVCHGALQKVRPRTELISASEDIDSVADGHLQVFLIAAQRSPDEKPVCCTRRDAVGGSSHDDWLPVSAMVSMTTHNGLMQHTFWASDFLIKCQIDLV